MFKFYLIMAIKNLKRRKRRTILTALAIAVGVYCFIFMDSMLSGMNRDGINNIINFETGHIQVVSKLRLNSDDESANLKNLLPGAKSLTANLNKIPGIAAVGRLEFSGTILNGIDELPIIAVGVNPQSDTKVFQTADFIKTGRWLHDGETGVVIGQRIAELMEFKVGDSVVLRTQTKQLSFQAIDLTIVGIAATPHPKINNSQVYIPLDLAQKTLGTGDAITRGYLRVKSTDRLSDTIKLIKDTGYRGTELKIETWREAAADYLAYMEGERASDMIFLFLVFIISVIGIVNTILLASLERVREIGILKAIGMVEKDIIRLFIYEGLGLGLLGGSVGLILGIVSNIFLVNFGIDLLGMYGNIDIGFPIATRVYGEWNWPVMFWTLVCGLIVSYLASYLPARKAAKLDPVEGLRRI